MILYLMREFSILKYAPVFLLFRKVKYHTPRTHKQTDNEEALIFAPKGPNTGTEAAAAFVACLSFFFFFPSFSPQSMGEKRQQEIRFPGSC